MEKTDYPWIEIRHQVESSTNPKQPGFDCWRPEGESDVGLGRKSLHRNKCGEERTPKDQQQPQTDVHLRSGNCNVLQIYDK